MDDLLRSYARLSIQRPWALLAFYAVVTALAVWRGAGIDVDAGLESLLPEDAPSVVALEEARSRRGGQDLFVIAVESPEPLATVQFVDALVEQFEGWEEVEYIDTVRDQSFFREHALLYLTIDDLENINHNLRRMIRQRLGDSHPLFEDLETPRGESEETWEWRDWRLWISPYTLSELAIEEDAIGTLFPFLSGAEDADDEGAADAAPLSPEEQEAERIRQARWDLPDAYQDYRIASHGRVAVFAAKLRGRSTNIEYARLAYERAQEAIAAADPASYHPELRAQVSGAYRSFLEVRAITHDATRATQIALVIILFLLIGFFRNLRSVYIVLTPLLVGVAWTLGALELIYGHLNTLTVFVFSMLVGMGVDFAIHIYRRMQEERIGGASWEVAAHHAISRTGRALVTATVTTVASLLMLSFASFDGFREFGVACGLGVAICLVTSILVIPPLVGASEKVMATRVAGAAGRPRSTATWPLNVARAIAAVLVVAGIAGVVTSDRVAFEYDFGNLEAPRDPNRIKYGSALGRTRSSAPAVMLGADEAQMREVHAHLSERLRNDDPLLRGFTTIATAVPSADDQEARMAVIDEIYNAMDRRAVRNIDGDEGEVIAELMRLTDVEPFGAEDMPEWSLQQIRERDGSYGSMGLLYGEYQNDHALSVAEFQEEFSTITVPSGEVRVSSNGFIIADVVRYVQADGKALALWVALGIFVVLLVDLRSPIAVVVCMSTLALGVALTVLGMVVFDIKLGLYNIVVLPTVLGVGIDGAVHIYHRFLEEGSGSTAEVMRTTGMAVGASSLTTAAGFVGLLMIEHNGIKTIGALAVLGILASMISALVVVAALVGRRGGPVTPAHSEAHGRD